MQNKAGRPEKSPEEVFKDIIRALTGNPTTRKSLIAFFNRKIDGTKELTSEVEICIENLNLIQAKLTKKMMLEIISHLKNWKDYKTNSDAFSDKNKDLIIDTKHSITDLTKLSSELTKNTKRDLLRLDVIQELNDECVERLIKTHFDNLPLNDIYLQENEKEILIRAKFVEAILFSIKLDSFILSERLKQTHELIPDSKINFSSNDTPIDNPSDDTFDQVEPFSNDNHTFGMIPANENNNNNLAESLKTDNDGCSTGLLFSSSNNIIAAPEERLSVEQNDTLPKRPNNVEDSNEFMPVLKQSKKDHFNKEITNAGADINKNMLEFHEDFFNADFINKLQDALEKN